jgi:hypothetical protein
MTARLIAFVNFGLNSFFNSSKHMMETAFGWNSMKLVYMHLDENGFNRIADQLALH